MRPLLDPNETAHDCQFASIRDEQRFSLQRQLVENLWTRYSPYADPGFRGKIARRFHHHFWEMYLACALMDQGHQLAPKHTDEGPDICVVGSGQRVWVEAIAPGRGEGPDAVPLPQVGRLEFVPGDKIILRLRSAIEEKWRKYQAYLSAGTILPDERYIVAVNGGYVPQASAAGSDLPYIVQAVSRLGPSHVTLDRRTLEVVDQGYSDLPCVEKSGGSEVSTGIFVDGGYEGISGVLYSGAWILNLPQVHGSEFVLVHNSLASNCLPRAWVKGLEFWKERAAWYGRANK